jgi:centromeric protein E
MQIVTDDPVRGAIIRKLTEEVVTNGVELLEVLRRGEHNRSYGSTTMNAESSRSHTIYRLSIESEEVDEDEITPKAIDPSAPGGVTRMSFLNLVDLAGLSFFFD